MELEERYRRKDGPIHQAFGLTYSAYLCIPRSMLQLMPLEWQEEFVRLVTRLPETPGYEVRRRGADGKFIEDEYREYRRPNAALCARIEEELSKQR